MYLALGILFLLFSLALAAGIICTLARSLKDGGELISKMNLLYLAPTFLIIYFLHLAASAYNGEELDFFYCFSLIYTTLDVLKFRAVKSLLMPICEAYPIYYLDFVIAFVVGGAAVIVSILSFFSHRIRNKIRVRHVLKNNGDVVLGDSANALSYAERTENCLVLGTDITRQRFADLIKSGYAVLRAPFEADVLKNKLNKSEHCIIVFRDGNYSYTQLIEQFTQLKKCGCRAKLHIEALFDEMKILKEKFVSQADKSACAYISCFSKYELMARRFVVDYPITKYIPRSFYNDNLTVKTEKSINVVFVGFGKVNYQLFRMCAMQFQFAQQSEGKLCVKPVNYYIFDNNDAALHNEFLSKILYEFDEDFKGCKFPKPEPICKPYKEKIDINSVDAKKKFKELVNKDSFTYFIISLENDLEDASYAQTVKRLLKDEDNYRIFVRTKNDGGEQLNGEKDTVIYFGEEKKIYSRENIVNDDLSQLAQRINLLYNEVRNAPDWLNELYNKPAQEVRKALDESLNLPENKNLLSDKWEELPFIEQASNLYHALNLPFKLNLLGFDMVKMKDENDVGITEAEFDKHYVHGGRKKGYDDYSLYFELNTGNVLAFIEHSRWNALYILYDYKQMNPNDMRAEDGKVVHKNVQKKQHACLTTYYGLNELVQYKFKKLFPDAEPKNNDERLLALGEVYKFDYMTLDRLYSEITAMGYKITPIRKPQ